MLPAGRLTDRQEDLDDVDERGPRRMFVRELNGPSKEAEAEVVKEEKTEPAEQKNDAEVKK